MYYLIRLNSNFTPKIVFAHCEKDIKRAYRNWELYILKDSKNPATFHTEWRASEGTRYMYGNKYCTWTRI